MEVLVDELARVLRAPKLAPLSVETLVVQSRGMERWLSRELASRLGVFAHASFPFPRIFLEGALNAVLGPLEGAARYERESLTWSIASLLAELRGEKGFAVVAGYLEDDRNGLRRVQLAQRVAHLFDQYAVYRPEMVLEWEAGKGADWQAVLWRALVARLGPSHFAARARDFEKAFSPLFVARGSLPARVCLVGGSSLPPLFLRLFGRLSEAMEVHLFALSPSAEYFAEGKSDGVHLAGGDVHPLLASLGSVGAALQQSLETEVNYVEGAAAFVDPGEDTVLHALQRDLLHNRVRGVGSAPHLPRPTRDDSVSVVSCHGPLREVEVLRDRLLGLFHADPSLSPEDIVVMAPRIEEYAPFIDAVFHGDPTEPHHIPYRVADRDERRINVAASAFLAVLAVLRGRLKASEVLDLLQAEPVRKRYGIEALDLPRIQRWVYDAGIRWGEDGEHRASYGLPPDERNTWRFGLRRLLLGYALSDDGATAFEGTVPHDDVTSDGALLLGKLSELCENLFAFRRRVSGAHSLGEWRTLLGELAGALLAEGEEWQLRPLYEAFYALELQGATAGFEEAVSLEVVAHLLSAHFESQVRAAEFLSGGVTFCAMLPLRSIPFRVVCLLGMNDGEFPRVEKHVGFDKMAERPRVGDRSTRADDRYLFLETLLSARDRLLVSYVGRGIQDNEARPPAVVVSELSQAVESLFAEAAPGGRVLLAPLEEPLQPWSPRHFDGREPRLASFDPEHARGAQALSGELFAESPFAIGVLHRASLPSQLDLEDLVRFFQNPARGLLRSLGLRIEDEAELVADREPVESEALLRYQVGARLLGAGMDEVLEGDAASSGALEAAELGRGLLPIGSPGRVGLRSIIATARLLRAARQPFVQAGKAPVYVLSLRTSEEPVVELEGALDRVYGRTQVECSFAKLGARHELAVWVRHLAARAAELPVEDAVLVGRSAKGPVSVRRFAPLSREDARALLFDLVSLYGVGQTTPLPLFPSASQAYVEGLRKKAGRDDGEARALDAARYEFSSARGFGEAHDPYVKLAFRGMDPLTTNAERPELTFAALSRRVFEPLLDHRVELATHSGSVREHRTG